MESEKQKLITVEETKSGIDRQMSTSASDVGDIESRSTFHVSADTA